MTGIKYRVNRCISAVLILLLVVSAGASNVFADTNEPPKEAAAAPFELTLTPIYGNGTEETENPINLQYEDGAFTGDLPVYSSTASKNVVDFKLELKSADPSVKGDLLYYESNRSYSFDETGIVRTEQNIVGQIGSYEFKIAAVDGKVYPVALEKKTNGVSFNPFSNFSIQNSGNVSYYGEQEGTLFQSDCEGALISDDKGNYNSNGFKMTPEHYYYNVYLSPGAYLKGKALVVKNADAAILLKVGDRDPIKDKNTKLINSSEWQYATGTPEGRKVELTLYSKTDEEITTTYTFFLYEGNPINVEFQKFSDVRAHFVKNKRDSLFDKSVSAQTVYMPPRLESLDMFFTADEGISLYKDRVSERNKLEKQGDAWCLPTGRGNITTEVIEHQAGVNGKWDSDKLIKLIAVNDADESQTAEYQFKLLQAPEGISTPDRLTEYMPAPGQFTVDNQHYNSFPQRGTLGIAGWDDCISLGAFGGYAVYEYDTPIKNDPANPYGIDFIVYGNNFGSSYEPGQVYVSKDNRTWYALAGSLHYEAMTDWNYSRAYQASDYEAKPEYWTYYRDKFLKDSSTSKTFNGICIANTGDKAPLPAFGYVDVKRDTSIGYGEPELVKGKAYNPYKPDSEETIGEVFDLSWAVDEQGKPVQLDEVNYVKIQTACDLTHSAFGENSTEVSTMVKAAPAASAVGTTSELQTLTINGQNVLAAKAAQTIDGTHTKYYEVDLNDKSLATVNVSAKGGGEDQISINNERYTGTAEYKGLLKEDGSRFIRVIAQNGTKEPVTYIIKCTGGGDPAKNADLSSVTLTPGDKTIKANAAKDKTYTFQVANNVEKVSLKIAALNYQAAMKLTGGSLTEAVTLESEKACEPLAIAEGENTFRLAVTSTDGSKTEEYTVKVIRAASAQTGPESNDIRVSFTFNGDVIHYDKDKQAYTGAHKKTAWIGTQTVTIPRGSTVKYVTDMMLYNAGIEFDNTDGTYISKVKIPGANTWLGEFDNGPNSGWMYRHNGRIADEGYAARVLSGGDSVEWFYTDDYTKESGYEGTWQPAPADPSLPSAGDTEVTTGDGVTTVPAETTVREDTATASVKKEEIAAMIEQAKKHESEEIVIHVAEKDTKEVETIQLQLPTEAIQAMTEQTAADLTVETANGHITLDEAALHQTVSQAKGAAVTIEIALAKQPTQAQSTLLGSGAKIVDITIKSGDTAISKFGNGKLKIRLSIPQALKGKRVGAVYVESDHKYETMPGEAIQWKKTDFYQFITSHLSTYALVDLDQLKALPPEDPATPTTPEEPTDPADPSNPGTDPGADKPSKPDKAFAKTKPVVKLTNISKSKIKASWKAVKGADGYAVYRADKSKGQYVKVKTVKNAKTRSFTDSGLKAGKTYYYKVKAWKKAEGKTIWTAASKAAKKKATLAAPKSFKAKAKKGGVTLSWAKVADADQYRIYRSSKKDGQYVNIRQTAKLRYTDKNVKKGKTYYYKVYGYEKVKKSGRLGAASAVKAVKGK